MSDVKKTPCKRVFVSSKLFFLATIDCAVKVRIYLPRRVLTPKNCGSFGVDEYCEVGSKFKAAHVKVMSWWIAWKLEELSRASVPK